MKNADLPAMPLTGDAYTDFSSHLNKGHGFEPECLGLTKREMFAMAAMQGLCANSIAGPHHAPDFLSKEAVMHADALLAELDKTK